MENTKGKTVPVSDETELEVAEEKNEDKPKKKPVRLTAEKIKEINDAMQNGCGKLELGKPFTIGGTEYTELEYDFNKLTGLEYAEAMDSDAKANTAFKVTYKQGLALFACAAAKLAPGLDMRDILENLGSEDAVEAVQLGTLFFTVSTQEGQRRISRR